MSDLLLKPGATTAQKSAYRLPHHPDVSTTQLAIVGLGAYVASLGPLDVRDWQGGSDASGGLVAVAETTIVYRAEPAADLLEQVDREQAWFTAHRASLAARFDCMYVAIHGGRVVDHDGDLAALVDRFFTAHGDAPCYFGLVGDAPASALAAAPGGNI
ncbi:MAG: hypothetical protein HY560_02440 [Gemmatimonadetes bacterium]|nr:hypothetical protein [Gemmatimonadota bacterium]